MEVFALFLILVRLVELGITIGKRERIVFRCSECVYCYLSKYDAS